MAGETMKIRFELLSAATFGRGEGLAGLVDQEVEHDEYGLPFLRGRALRGLLAEEVEAILFALGNQRAAAWAAVRDELLGVGGRFDDEAGILHVGDARLPADLYRLLASSVESSNDPRVDAAAMLNALTAIRRQTAMTPYGAPKPATLRSVRVVLRKTPFEAELRFDVRPTERHLALLAAAVLAWRRAGAGRNRGRGRLVARIGDEATTREYFAAFAREVLPS